ncbi:rhodanese-like domain-containing protein [Luteolibacter marinus]|uniref:rhodanese-like domain-containing protein n=1 Tax=Luteolibacter marinus TaxID=2776705 RepID=UPI0018663EA0|nr:rhodanese-like domain-containing protein [Luteolibacter marinus]
MRAATELVLILAVAALGALATWKISGPPSREVPCDPASLGADEICLATLTAEWPEGSFIWIDARSESEWKDGGVPGSIHLTTVSEIPFDQQIEASFEKLATAQRVVVYCSTAACGTSKEVVKRLNELGMIPEVRALHGGWDALKQAGMVTGSSSGH